MPPKQKRTKHSSGAVVDPLCHSGSEDAYDTSSSNSDDNTSVDSDMEIQVDFEVCAIDEDDFHGISRLLRQVFLKSNVDISGLTDIIIKQADHLGSLIKVSEDSDDQVSAPETESSGPSTSDSDCEGKPVFGVTSLINLDFHQDKDCVKQIKEMLLSQCKLHGGSMLSSFSSLLSKPVGLLINERFLNIPAEIAPPLLKGLMAELKVASKKMHKQFSLNKRKRRGKGRKTKAATDVGDAEASHSAPVFDYVECEFLQKDSAFSFNYPVSEESDQVLGGKWSFDDSAMKSYRTVLVFEAHKFDKAVLSLEKYVV